MDTQLIGEVRWKERSFKVDGETKQFSVCLLMNESDTDSASASRWCDFFRRNCANSRFNRQPLMAGT